LIVCIAVEPDVPSTAVAAADRDYGDEAEYSADAIDPVIAIGRAYAAVPVACAVLAIAAAAEVAHEVSDEVVPACNTIYKVVRLQLLIRVYLHLCFISKDKLVDNDGCLVLNLTANSAQ